LLTIFVMRFCSSRMREAALRRQLADEYDSGDD